MFQKTFYSSSLSLSFSMASLGFWHLNLPPLLSEWPSDIKVFKFNLLHFTKPWRTGSLTNIAICFAYQLFGSEKKSTISKSFAYPVMTVKFGAKGPHLRIHLLRLRKKSTYFVYSLCFEHIESIFQRYQNRINMKNANLAKGVLRSLNPLMQI